MIRAGLLRNPHHITLEEFIELMDKHIESCQKIQTYNSLVKCSGLIVTLKNSQTFYEYVSDEFMREYLNHLEGLGYRVKYSKIEHTIDICWKY